MILVLRLRVAIGVGEGREIRKFFNFFPARPPKAERLFAPTNSVVKPLGADPKSLAYWLLKVHYCIRMT